MNNQQEIPRWKAMELKPLNLDEIPDVLRHFIYPEEQKNGVLCRKTVFMTVLLLRWALSGPEYGYEREYEGRKVFWNLQDGYGFRTTIILYSDEEAQYDALKDKTVTLQEASWVELAELQCRGACGVIDGVIVNNGFPYGKNLKFDGKTGVTRLIEDAMVSSYHTEQRISHWPDPARTYSRREDDGFWYQLSFKVEDDIYSGVTSIDVEGGEEKSPW